eukprot:CAMPEP_0167777366 /NCGR_PEP_ID=MMETSP0111_2-20121227/3654_1 /TAXON_ID=91324 /ORGANISM="Lotharella globosa, Strain CCCM811" /LENGTH=545 /DNA_ID=CAMNT_0007667543 /DNA_START=159 /DNA_END=1792 /DNA_ORIENTATION=-
MSGHANRGSGKAKTVGPYLLGRPLGFGTTSRVHLAIHSVTKTAAAVKIIRKVPNLDLRKLQREISILRLLDHRYITKLYDVFESKNHIYMVMELVDGGELFDHIIQQKRLRRWDALRIFHQVVEATSYFHSHGIVHRDIKPENILVHSSGDIKIADFGFAIARRDGQLRTSCGSPHYACPEVCSSSVYDGTKADSWSLGVLLFVLITGDFPFNDQNYGALFHRIQTGKYMIPSYVDRDIAELITMLLMVDPDQRLTVDGILAHSCMKPFESKLSPPTTTASDSSDVKSHPPSSPSKPAANAVSSMEVEKQPAPMVKRPFDTRAIQELIFLGWGDDAEDVSAKLEGKDPSVDTSIRRAYLSLAKKFALANGNAVDPEKLSMEKSSAHEAQSASASPGASARKRQASVPSLSAPVRESRVANEERTGKNTGSCEPVSMERDEGLFGDAGGKKGWEDARCGARCNTMGRRRRWGAPGGDGNGTRTPPQKERAPNGRTPPERSLEICTGGPTAAIAVTAAPKQGNPGTRNGGRVTADPVRIRNPILKGG